MADKKIIYDIIDNLSIYDEFIDDKTVGKSPRTTETYVVEIRMLCRFLNQFYKSKLKTEISIDNIGDNAEYFNMKSINAYRKHLLKNYASSSAQKKLSIAKNFTYFLGTRGYLDNSFLKDVEDVEVHKKEVIFLNKEQRVQLINSLKNYKTWEDFRDYTIIYLILTTGLRGFEVRELKMENIDWKNKKLTFYGKGKNKAFIRTDEIDMSVVELDAHATNLLKIYIDKYRKTNAENPCDEVFTTKYGTPISSQVSLIKTVSKRLKNAGFDDSIVNTIKPHKLRASFVTSLAERGEYSTFQIMIKARHKQIATTTRYVGLDEKISKNMSDTLMSDYITHDDIIVA